MKKTRVILVFILTMVINILSGQESLTLTFSGQRGDECYQRLDYMTVRNTMRDWQEMLYYPDTTFIIDHLTGIESFLDSDLISVTPNPCNGEFRIGIDAPLSSHLNISVYEITGILCAKYQSRIAPGFYSFSVQLSKPNPYLLSVSTDYLQYTTKVFNLGSNGSNQIDLISYNNETRPVCAWDPTDHPFEYGDVMEYVGYVNYDGFVEASNIIIQPQYGDEDIILQFDALIPEVTTTDVTNITQTTATCGGEVVYDGGAAVIDRGICWSTDPEPTIDDTYTSCGDGIGGFSSQLTRLNMNTTYYVRSYAVNSVGIGYGNEVSFTTPPIGNIKLLSIGNSYSEDALAYVPFILENMNVDANIQIGILSKGGASLITHVDNFENQAPNYKYYHYDEGGAWQRLGQQTIQFALDNYDWDIVMLQQFSGSAANWSSYQPSLDTLTSLLGNYLDYPVKFGWYMVQSRPGMSVNGPNYPDETIESNYTSIATNAQRVLDETACEFVVPVGTAIQNARTILDIKALGNYADNVENTSGLGYLVTDGIHLQEGLPSQIAAYAFVLSILEQYGALQTYSIIGESTRVTPEWIVGKSIPGPNGTPVGSDDINCLIGQESAVEALYNPFETTDMNR